MMKIEEECKWIQNRSSRNNKICKIRDYGIWFSLGHEMFFKCTACYMKMDANSNYLGNILNDFDAIIPRLKPHDFLWLCSVRHQSIGQPLSIRQRPLHSLETSSILQLFYTEWHSYYRICQLSTRDKELEMVNGAPLIIKL